MTMTKHKVTTTTVTIPYEIKEVSGEDPNFPASNVLPQTSSSSWWLTAARCSYPQTMVLEVCNSCSPSLSLEKLRILSHESKIASKVELLVQSSISSSFRRLGYIDFDSNEKSSHRARELKAVNLSTYNDIKFIKLVVHGCHPNNKYNKWNQAGFVSIKLEGKEKVTANTPSDEEPPKQRLTTNVEKSSITKGGLVDEQIRERVAELEKEKMSAAAIEDYEEAARIKKIIVNTQNSYNTLKEMNKLMLEAATKEDFMEAMRLKTKRDDARKLTIESLELSIDHYDLSYEYRNSELEMSTRAFNMNCKKDNGKEESHNIIIVDERPKAPASTSSEDEEERNYQYYNKGDESISDYHVDGARSEFHSDYEEESDVEAVNEDEAVIDNDDEHPLEGVKGYHDLPIPEELKPSDETNELFVKLNQLIGPYRTRCFLSKNWSLREAALTKTSLLLDHFKSQVGGIEKAASTLCQLLEAALDDKVVQVFLTGLILLDDCLAEFEEEQLSRKRVIRMLENIVRVLVTKLGDNKAKVVDGAETTLLSFALSNCVGANYIGSIALKKLQPSEIKSGRTVCARLHLLSKLVEEFGDDAIDSKRVLDFVKGVVAHKDGEVREIAKEVVLGVLNKGSIEKEQVINMLKSVNISERQLKEYVALLEYD